MVVDTSCLIYLQIPLSKAFPLLGHISSPVQAFWADIILTTSTSLEIDCSGTENLMSEVISLSPSMVTHRLKDISLVVIGTCVSTNVEKSRLRE